MIREKYLSLFGTLILTNSCLIGSTTVSTFEEVDKKEVVEETKDSNANTKPISLLLLGPPGSARGVLALKIAKTFSIPQISTADLIIEYLKSETEIGEKAKDCLNSGKAIPDSLLFEMLDLKIANSDKKQGLIINGIPRTIEQAEGLIKLIGDKYQLKPIYIQVSDDTLFMRTGRLVCVECGGVYNTQSAPPTKSLICDICNAKLVQREDDDPEYVKSRLECYHKNIEPVLELFKKENILIEVDGNSGFEYTFEEIEKICSDLNIINKK